MISQEAQNRDTPFLLARQKCLSRGCRYLRNYPRISVNSQRISIIGYLRAPLITSAEGQENKEQMNTWYRESRHSGDTQGKVSALHGG